jgi:ribose 5-phosphate isomerase B
MDTISLGTDHAGYALKEAAKAYIASLGYEVSDLGANDDSPSDYPDFIIPAVEMAVKEHGRAIVFGGSGIGECIAANKVKGARAALCYDLYTAKMSREHNDANVLCLGGRTVTKDMALTEQIIKTWLETPFSGEERHVRRLKKIADYEG